MTAPEPQPPRPARGKDVAGDAPPEPDPPWLPDDADVVAEATFTAPSGRQYRVLRTTESDAYDTPLDQRQEDDAPPADPALHEDLDSP